MKAEEYIANIEGTSITDRNRFMDCEHTWDYIISMMNGFSDWPKESVSIEAGEKPLITPSKSPRGWCNCTPEEQHGETSIMCCNRCGKPTEDFWQKPVEAGEKQPDSEHEIRELMAILHGDGGHYVAEHGLLKAIQDAKELINTKWVVGDTDTGLWEARFKDQVQDQEWFLVKSYEAELHQLSTREYRKKAPTVKTNNESKAIELIKSALAIAIRKGEQTYWEGFELQCRNILAGQSGDTKEQESQYSLMCELIRSYNKANGNSIFDLQKKFTIKRKQ